MIDLNFDKGNFEEIVTDEIIKDINNIIEKTLEVEKIKGNFEVSLSFVDEAEIKEVNGKYRNKPVETDVLSFPMLDEFEIRKLKEGKLRGQQLLGDIIISVPRAIEQAKDFNHSVRREICFLACHSILHLIGYDHMQEDESEKMQEKERLILEMLGITREV